MSLREELELAMASISQAKASPISTQVDRARDLSLFFIRNNGQALLDALEDAGRWRTFRHLTSVMDASFVDSFERIVPDSDDPEDILKAMNQAIDIARSNAPGQAIDAAIKGDGAKPTP